MSDDRLIASTGNVFSDLDFEHPEEELLKAKLSRQLRAALRERSLGDDEAAGILGLRPADVSAITTSRTGSFSIEQLVHCLDLLDYRVDINVERKQRPGNAALA